MKFTTAALAAHACLPALYRADSRKALHHVLHRYGRRPSTLYVSPTGESMLLDTGNPAIATSIASWLLSMMPASNRSTTW